jgi:hypothetical protein
VVRVLRSGGHAITVTCGRSGEPPSAGPHARWCGRGRRDTGPYPIETSERNPLTIERMFGIVKE